MLQINHNAKVCTCRACSVCIDFDVPEHLVDAAAEGRLVIFAGAGISTENHYLFPLSFFAEVVQELGDRMNVSSFPAAMTKFCERADGRSQLLLKVRRRIE